MVCEPGVRQEFAQPIGGMRRQTLQDILEIGERIDLGERCRRQRFVLADALRASDAVLSPLDPVVRPVPLIGLNS